MHLREASSMLVRTVRPALAGFVVLALSGCGGGSSGPTNPPVTTLPAPAATPTPTPPPGSNDCVPGGDCSTNHAAVVRAQLRIYRLFNNRGQLIETPDPVKQNLETPIPVGFTIFFDVTGRDAENKETLGPSGDGEGIVWHLSDESKVLAAGTPSNWQRKYQVKEPGRFTIFVTFDDVGSNDLRMSFEACVPGQYGCVP
jgi:hypothetical protein